MITDERQCQITRDWVQRFTETLASLDADI